MRKATVTAIVITALAMLVLWVVRSFMPPNLSGCTRLQIRCPEGAMRHFFSHRDGLFNADEEEYIRSCDTYAIEDVNQIKSFADAVSRGIYRSGRPFINAPALTIICYRGSRRMASLEVYANIVVAGNWNRFNYPMGLLGPLIPVPTGIQRLKSRYYCARDIGGIPVPRAGFAGYGSAHRDASQWCDAVVEYVRQHTIGRSGEPISDTAVADIFRCPTRLKPADASEYLKPEEVKREDTIKRFNEPVREWVSDYAMNPNCEPNSPGDTVLLFETKAGWNQHGGPELFNFDNHDPKGGCVLLNGGEVKFIRTKEELAQLRWKP